MVILVYYKQNVAFLTTVELTYIPNFHRYLKINFIVVVITKSRSTLSIHKLSVSSYHIQEFRLASKFCVIPFYYRIQWCSDWSGGFIISEIQSKEPIYFHMSSLSFLLRIVLIKHHSQNKT